VGRERRPDPSPVLGIKVGAERFADLACDSLVSLQRTLALLVPAAGEGARSVGCGGEVGGGRKKNLLEGLPSPEMSFIEYRGRRMVGTSE